jgi:preprotein translocase subunit SecD
MQLVLSWPVRIVVIGLLILSLVVDGAGYIVRLQNHCPLTGNCPQANPPNLLGTDLFIHRGLDISGGTRMILQLTDIPPGRDRNTIQQEAIAVINNRVNTLGVSEPQISAQGPDRIEVDLAGISAARAQQVIGRTDRLVLTKWVKDPNAPSDSPEPGYRPQLTGVTGDMLTSASAAVDTQGTGGWVVNLQFNSAGAALFGSLTTAAANACTPGQCAENFLTWWLDLTQNDINQWDNQNYVQLLLQTKFVTNPQTNGAIPGGQAQISGGFTQQTAQQLAANLNAGALPANITVLQSTDVGATLGADSVKRSLIAGLLGLIVVILFMLIYYRLPGLIASLALIFYAGVVLMLFKLFGVVLSLAGMAGFVLSVGMAVDANVLIFERFKEEVRVGRTVGAAVEAAVRRAWPAIRDSNISTGITSAILLLAGSGQVKGFAFTLLIGVGVSMLSSIVVTHNLLGIVLADRRFRQPALIGATSGSA